MSGANRPFVLRVCCRADANATITKIAEAVGEVYAAVGLQVESDKDAAAAAADESDSAVTTSGGSASKRTRRSSGAGATDKAIEGFATVMSAFLPPPPPPPPEKLTWALWAKQCMLTDEQKKAVRSCLPDPTMEPEPALLACFDAMEDLADTCQLKKMQIACWAKLASGKQ